MGGACSTYGREESCIQGVNGQPQGKRPCGKPRHRWEDKIKVDLQEVGFGAWTGLIWLSIGTSGGHLGMW